MRVRVKKARPPKPYETFPLFAHARGYWAKKISKRAETFGPGHGRMPRPTRESWLAAPAAFKQYQESRALGTLVRDRPDQISVGLVVNGFLTRQEDRVGAGDAITARSFAEARDLHRLPRRRRHRHDDRRSGAMPRYDHQVPGGARRRYGWHAYNKRMAILSQMFKWAEHPLEGILPAVPAPAPVQTQSRHPPEGEKQAQEAETGKDRFTRDELTALFTLARNPLRCWIRLGYFAAFGNSDCADVPQTAVNLEPDPELKLPEGWAYS